MREDTSPGPGLSSTDFGPARLRLALTAFAIAAAILAAGLVWLGPAGLLDMNAPDFMPLPAGFAGAFALFGLIHLGQGLIDLARRRATGLSRLEARPARLGARFSGRIVTDRDVAASGPFTILLACEKISLNQDEDSSTRRVTTLLWEARVNAPQRTRTSLGLPFAFDIPANGLASVVALREADDAIVWKLTARAPMTGLDYIGDFRIEVLPAEAGEAPAEARDEAPFAGQRRPEQPGTRLARIILGVAAALIVAAGAYASLNQLWHSWNGVAVAGRIVSVARPVVEVALGAGETVTVRGVSKRRDWRVGDAVDLTCRSGERVLRSCRMDTAADRWIDALGTLAAGLAIAAVAGWLWRRKSA